LLVATFFSVIAYYLTGPVEAVQVFLVVLAFLRGLQRRG
jgi:hypothetical protein